MTSLINSTVFNTNPVCFGNVVTETVHEPFATAQFAVFVSVAVFIVITGLFFIWRRRNRRRLQNHSLVPVVLGSFGGAIWILVRSYYNLVGKEYISCQGFLFLYYGIVPLMQISDWFEMIYYVDKLAFRQNQTAVTLIAVNMEKKEQTSLEHLGRASAKCWLTGLYNHSLLFADFFFMQDHKFREAYAVHAEGKERFRAVSRARKASYDIIAVFVYTLPQMIAFFVRAFTDPVQINCTGCGLAWTDYAIQNVLLLFPLFPTMAFLYKHWETPDALGVVREFILVSALTTPIIFVFGFITALDPDQIMQQQRYDWFIGESVTIFIFHFFRCVRTVHITARTQRWGESHVTLMEVLNDPHASLLFEKYLISELANENLIFWREATAFKRGYGTRDFDMSQEMARILFRSFIGQHAHMPINISHDLAESIKQGCRGVISRNVFDPALIDVYNLLSKGPFLRFVKSKEFKEYSKNRIDFSLGESGMPHQNSSQVFAADSPATNIEAYVRML